MTTISKVITLRSGKIQRNLKRLTRWGGFEFGFNGQLRNKKYSGYKMYMPNGDMVVHLWYLN